MHKVIKLLKNVIKYAFIAILWCIMLIHLLFYDYICDKIIGNMFYTGTWEVVHKETLQQSRADFYRETQYLKEDDKKRASRLIIFKGSPFAIVSIKGSLHIPPSFLVNYDVIVDPNANKWEFFKEQRASFYDVVSGGLGHINIISGNTLAIPLRIDKRKNYKKIDDRVFYYKPE